MKTANNESKPIKYYQAIFDGEVAYEHETIEGLIELTEEELRTIAQDDNYSDNDIFYQSWTYEIFGVDEDGNTKFIKDANYEWDVAND